MRYTKTSVVEKTARVATMGTPHLCPPQQNATWQVQEKLGRLGQIKLEPSKTESLGFCRKKESPSKIVFLVAVGKGPGKL